MKNYYETLGISLQADEAEIKRAYRKLAVMFHPDKNPTVEAAQLIQEINEAYDTLGDPEKKVQYDLLTANPWATPMLQEKRPMHRDPAYRRKPQGYTPPPSESAVRLEMMRNGLGFMRAVSLVGAFCCIMLGFDYFLPPVILREKVIIDMEEIKRVVPKHHMDLLVTDRGHHFPVAMSEVNYFPEGSRIKIMTSRIFSLLICVESQHSDFQVNNLATIYRNFAFGPVVLIFFCFLSLFGNESVEFRYTIGIAIIMVMFLNVIFLYMSRI